MSWSTESNSPINSPSPSLGNPNLINPTISLLNHPTGTPPTAHTRSQSSQLLTYIPSPFPTRLIRLVYTTRPESLSRPTLFLGNISVTTLGGLYSVQNLPVCAP